MYCRKCVVDGVGYIAIRKNEKSFPCRKMIHDQEASDLALTCEIDSLQLKEVSENRIDGIGSVCLFHFFLDMVGGLLGSSRSLEGKILT